MESRFDPFDAPPIEHLAAARAAAYSALGQLDGALAFASPATLELFAYMMVRTSLTGSLKAAGISDGERGFDDWLTGSGGGPMAGPGAAAEPIELVATVLRELACSSWRPIADATALLLRAAPHLAGPDRGPVHEMVASGTNFADETTESNASVVAEARDLLMSKGSQGSAELEPLDGLQKLLSEASASFVPIERRALLIETWDGRATVTAGRAYAHDWAIALLMGEWCAMEGLLKQPIPLVGSVRGEALRQDIEPTARAIVVANGLEAASLNALDDLHLSKLHVARSDGALQDRRRTSRAPAVFAAIAGFGIMSRSQIARAFKMTPAGVAGILCALVEADLIRPSEFKGGGYQCVGGRSRGGGKRT